MSLEGVMKQMFPPKREIHISNLEMYGYYLTALKYDYF